ncbi:MAG: ATP-binding cassette domain-containing protein [Nitriliruptorales bacterium]|nr:ATP-binding cassette domain-containing protein [Nitriliruptorales bacterium]
MSIIEVRDLVKVYRRGNVRAVDGVSLDVEDGEIFGFLGPNGAGKTTTVRILTTLLSPTSGTAVVAGHDVVADPAAVRKSIGVALQEVGLDGLQTGREFLELQAALFAVADPRARAVELLDVVGLTDAADRRVRTYSGGMKRRLDLAAGLVHRPRVLFLDEPTTGLDPASRENVWAEVRRLNAAGTTILLTTQYLEEADALCDRLAIIDQGRIVAAGTPEELKASVSEDLVRLAMPPRAKTKVRAVLRGNDLVTRFEEDDGHVDVYVTNGQAAVPALVRALSDSGVVVPEISLRRPTLDDVFLRSTGHRLEGADAEPAAEPPAAADTARRRRTA